MSTALKKVKQLRGFNSVVFITISTRTEQHNLRTFFHSLNITVNVPNTGVVRVARTYKYAHPFSTLFEWGYSKSEYGVGQAHIRTVSATEFLRLQKTPGIKHK